MENVEAVLIMIYDLNHLVHIKVFRGLSRHTV